MTSNPQHVVDAGAGIAVVASIAGYLPPIAAALGIIWYCIQIYEYFRKRRLEAKKDNP